MYIVQRAQEQNEYSARAAGSMLTRIADFLAIPRTAGSPITLGELDQNELGQCRTWPTSLVQYITQRGLAIAQTGSAAWPDEGNEWKSDTRVPPILGSGKNRKKTPRRQVQKGAKKT